MRSCPAEVGLTVCTCSDLTPKNVLLDHEPRDPRGFIAKVRLWQSLGGGKLQLPSAQAYHFQQASPGCATMAHFIWLGGSELLHEVCQSS